MTLKKHIKRPSSDQLAQKRSVPEGKRTKKHVEGKKDTTIMQMKKDLREDHPSMRVGGSGRKMKRSSKNYLC